MQTMTTSNPSEWRSRREAIGKILALAVCLAVTGSSEADVYTLYATDVPKGQANWEEESKAEDEPQDFNCDNSTYAHNDVVSNEDYLEAIQFELFTLPLGQTISKIEADALARYNNGDEGSIRMRIEIPSRGIVDSIVSSVFSADEGQCEWRMSVSDKDDITHLLDDWTAADINDIIVSARRITDGSNTIMRVKAFRIVITTLECSPGCPADWPGDCFCDPVCDTEACGYDGGDCPSNCDTFGLTEQQMPQDWCPTDERWTQTGFGPECFLGTCDDPIVRDAHIPSPDTPTKTIRLRLHVFANTDGSDPAASQTDVDAQVAQMNIDGLPHRIQYSYTTEFVNDSTYRQFSDSEAYAMKVAYADAPELQCNIYVVDINSFYVGVGTFPWDSSALAVEGGVIIDKDYFGSGQSTLTHELGHCLGLWHTHHGVDEVFLCDECYELADGTNAETTGDLCGDTPPTPTNFLCCDPGQCDDCLGVHWGATDFHNYMGYAGDPCWSEFSSHQSGRMHCWIEDVLNSWLDDGAPTEVIYVDARNDSGCENGTIECPFNTVIEGNNTATDGTTIIIFGGNYAESLTMNKSLTLTNQNGVVRIGGV